MAVTGYPSQTSVLQGEAIGLHLSSDATGPVELSVHRVGAVDELVYSDMVTVMPQPVPSGGAQIGFGWSETTSITIPSTWLSGLYRVTVGNTAFHFVVRAALPGAYSSILLMYPATTGQAYNNNQDTSPSLYEFNSPGGIPANQVSFDRPDGLDYFREQPFARWFDGAGIATEACTSLDLHASPELLAAYRLVVSMGHDEYWSREMRDAVEAFVTAGGNAAFFSGNTCWWQIRFEADNRIMVCYKDAAADPLTGTDNSRVTVNWADAPVYRPENSLTGVGWRLGAQVGPQPGYVCRFPEHWVFDGLELAEGETFAAGFVGYEVDACDFVEICGRPRATGRDGTPPSFVILATADYSALGAPAPGYGTMGLYRRGGTVFTGASTDWGLGLAAGDPALDAITRNVVMRLATPMTSGEWERVGEAINVVAMAAEGGRLFAATEDGRLWEREATAQNMRWTVIGAAPDVVVLAANGYAKWTQQQPLYALSAGNTLLSRSPNPGGAWSVADSGNGCTALAVANSGVVYASDASTLWSWDRNRTPSWAPVGPTGIGIRFLAAQYRSLVACDNDGALWRRDLNAGGDWQRLGDSVPELTAMAITESAIFAATLDGTLWRRDLPHAVPDRHAVGPVVEVAVAPLSDRRLEVWAGDAQGGLFSTWKVTADPDADWAQWSNFLTEVGSLPTGAREVAVAPLPDGRLHLWVTDTSGNLFTTWKTSTDPNATWMPWWNFQAEVGSLPGGARSVAVAPLPDGRLELWAADAQGGLFTTWKVDPHPDANWAPWSNFLAEVGGLPAPVHDIAVAPLQDGRLHLWVTDANGGLFTTWKLTADPNAAWAAPWWDFLSEVTGLSAARYLAVAPLSDGRLELWVADPQGGLFTTWKVDADPNGNWQTPWSDFLGEVGGLPTAARQAAVAPLPDGRLHFWVTDTQGGLFTTWKLTTDPNANWASPWYPFNEL
jgi:hypothetical protein